MLGRGAPPDWAVIYNLANQWGIPPWQFEEECSEYWWERILTYRRVAGEIAEKKRG